VVDKTSKVSKSEAKCRRCPVTAHSVFHFAT
jgi:hypothetical protein